METTSSFGYWMRRQRKALDLTQQVLAERVGCSLAAIKKIESDERRPSRQIAERLADILDVPASQREMFLEVARGLHSADQLSLAREPTSPSHPSGTVTFLYTDIEGSTRLAQQYRDTWEALRKRHHGILRQAIEAHNGYVFQIIGDEFCAAFHTAGDAVHAAMKSQIDLQAENWGETPIRVRMGIHTGKAEVQPDGLYHGYLTLSHAQRLMSAGHGGQVLLSFAAQELMYDELPEDVELRDLGKHRLKDFDRPEHLFQLNIADLPSDFPPLHTLDSHRHNLPLQLTSFVGREKEIREVIHLLGKVRLVTLVGPGGTGKTRLSIQVANEILNQYPDGVWWVELDALADERLVPQTVAKALGVREAPNEPMTETLANVLRAKEILLVIDNCEHLIAACAQLAERLLHACPKLRILATSREPLSIPGEMIWSVPPLSLPDPQPWRDPASGQAALLMYQQSEAVRLFVARAAAVSPHFGLTAQNGAWVADICRRLDGIPLAIELAAARVKVLTVEHLAARLDDRFNLLTGGSRTALPRHQTLRATIDWSYDLLPEEARLLLRRLAVFAGGFTLEAAEQICSGEPLSPRAVLDLLARLVDRSLVIVDQQQEEERYRMLETIRQYARAQLAASGEAEAIRRRHAEFFTAWVEQMAMELRAGPTQLERFAQLEVEHDNIRAALEWSLVGADGELGLRLMGAIFYYWYRRGHWVEWGHRMTLASAHPDHVSEATRAATLVAMSALDLFGKRDSEASRRHSREALSIYRRLGDRRNIAWTIYWLTAAAVGIAKDYAQSVALTEEAIALLRHEGDLAGVAHCLANLGELAYAHGDLVRAKAAYQETLRIAREIGDQLREHVQYLNLGNVAVTEGNYDEAATLYRRSLMWARESLATLLTVDTLACLAALLALSGSPQRTARLMGASEALRESRGTKLQINEQRLYDQSAALVREQLGDEAFETLRSEGQTMTLEQAIKYALEATAPREPAAQPPSPRQAAKEFFGGLTEREREVAALIAQGKSNREIAEAMTVGAKTVETYVTRILNKLNFDSRVQIATWAVKKGLVSSNE